MSGPIDELGWALLHEGHLLYPYDPRAAKNRRRWLFGRLYPEACCRAGADASSQETEVLLVADRRAEVEVRARFVQIAACEGATLAAVPREIAVPAVTVGDLEEGPRAQPFAFPAERGAGRRTEAIAGAVEIGAVAAQGAYRLRVVVRNAVTPPEPVDDEAALLFTMASTHALVTVRAGAFVSPRDPPVHLADLARACRCTGAWPILLGPAGARDRVLCSPIILDDHPEVAPESPGDLFDAVEIDELLTLHILALTDEEKQVMAAGDEQVAAALRRTEALTPEQRLRLHGRLVRRGPEAAFAPGDRVVIRPRGRADVLDVALTGKRATVFSVDEDVDGRVQVGVTVDDDPGRDLADRGHRFFFAPEELAPLDPGARS
jgi:hypothetical protein